jgi:hypothetical protein
LFLPKKESVFFFEKKNQKTFGRLGAPLATLRLMGRGP